MFRTLFSNKHLGHWIRIGAEYIALILLITHLLPPKLLEEWRNNGFAAIVLLGFSLLMAMYFKYRSETVHKKEVDSKNQMLQEKDKEINLLKRATAYANVFPILNEGFSKLHNTVRGQHNESEFREAFKDFCTKLSHVFRTVTGTECHVCIKIPVKTRANQKITSLKARTLVRDALSVNRDGVDTSGIDHSFQNNTDFEFIFNHIKSEKGRFYFNNNLPATPQYKNTSFFARGGSATYFPDGTSIEEREKQWPLPYKATITVPICPGISDQRHLGTLFGFLCIDSVSAGVFSEKIDAELVYGCADGLYNPLKTYIETFLLKR